MAQGNSPEIKVTIDFRSNFVHWIFIAWELQFWNKKGGCPCSLRSSEALKMPHFRIIQCLLEERIASNNCNFCDREFWEHALNYSQYIVSDKNKHFRFELDRKLNPWLKFEPIKFLAIVTKRQIEKTIVYPLFSLFIQFLAIEIRWVFSHAKLMISWLQWLEKNVRCPCSLVSYSHFSTDRAQYQGKSAVFPMHVCTSAR